MDKTQQQNFQQNTISNLMAAIKKSKRENIKLKEAAKAWDVKYNILHSEATSYCTNLQNEMNESLLQCKSEIKDNINKYHDEKMRVDELRMQLTYKERLLDLAHKTLKAHNTTSNDYSILSDELVKYTEARFSAAVKAYPERAGVDIEISRLQNQIAEFQSKDKVLVQSLKKTEIDLSESKKSIAIMMNQVDSYQIKLKTSSEVGQHQLSEIVELKQRVVASHLNKKVCIDLFNICLYPCIL